MHILFGWCLSHEKVYTPFLPSPFEAKLYIYFLLLDMHILFGWIPQTIDLKSALFDADLQWARLHRAHQVPLHHLPT